MMKRWLAALAVLSLIVAACGDGDDTGAEDTTTTEAVEETTTTEAMEETTTTTEAMEEEPTVGTADNPIKVLFVPSVSAEEIVAGGELLDQALTDATGLEFEVQVPASYAATIEEICASPDSSIGFIPAQAYVLGSELCGIDIALKAERFGYTEYWAQFIAPRDSDISSLADVAGATWAYPDAGSTSGFLVPSGTLGVQEIEVGGELEAGGHDGVVRAVYNGEADFGTTFFSPATDADGNSLWDGTDEGADVPAELVEACGVDADGQLSCGEGYTVRDARRNVREELPDVIQQVKIFAVSDPIPNDGVAFGPDFPEDLRAQIVDAMLQFAADDPEAFGTALDAYSWDNIVPAADSDFDAIRAIVQQLGITLDQL